MWHFIIFDSSGNKNRAHVTKTVSYCMWYSVSRNNHCFINVNCILDSSIMGNSTCSSYRLKRAISLLKCAKNVSQFQSFSVLSKLFKDY